MIKRLTGLVAAVALMTPAAAATGDGPAAYVQRVTVTPALGVSLQRVDLPARVLVAARDPALADVRIFDAQGQALPTALSKATASAQRLEVPLPIMPILGAADALNVTGVSLRIDDQQRASVVRVDGTPQPSGSSRLLGILLDARRIEGPVSAIALDVATPTGQPVTFTIESSTDLMDWQAVADKVIYRTNNQARRAEIGFPKQDLHGHYLRVTWQAASRLLEPVSIRSAHAITMRSGVTSAPRVVLTVPPSSDPHVIEFTVPFAVPITALEIEPAGGDTVLPVRILGRNQPEQPWTPIAEGSVFRITRNGAPRTNPAFAMNGLRYGTLRIEADPRTAGFAKPPTIAARLRPAELVFLATGPAPFTLAAGRIDAQPVFLSLSELIKANGGGTAAALPYAGVARQADPVIATLAIEHSPSWRRIALWAVLLLGTALLAAMVWMLMRRREAAPA